MELATPGRSPPIVPLVREPRSQIPSPLFALTFYYADGKKGMRRMARSSGSGPGCPSWAEPEEFVLYNVVLEGWGMKRLEGLVFGRNAFLQSLVHLGAMVGGTEW